MVLPEIVFRESHMRESLYGITFPSSATGAFPKRVEGYGYATMDAALCVLVWHKVSPFSGIC
jgi:hypothetical protein